MGLYKSTRYFNVGGLLPCFELDTTVSMGVRFNKSTSLIIPRTSALFTIAIPALGSTSTVSAVDANNHTWVITLQYTYSNNYYMLRTGWSISDVGTSSGGTAQSQDPLTVGALLPIFMSHVEGSKVFNLEIGRPAAYNFGDNAGFEGVNGVTTMPTPYPGSVIQYPVGSELVDFINDVSGSIPSKGYGYVDFTANGIRIGVTKFPSNYEFGIDTAAGCSTYGLDATMGAYLEAFIENRPDPYGSVPGATGPGGTGTGTIDPTAWTDTDDIDFPDNPGVSAVNTGFISLWSPTEQQMLNLSRYMWNVDITTIDFWRRLWADPMDVIYGLHIIPVDFRATGRTIIGGTEHVVVGLVDTKVDMDYLVSQWIEVDCGSLNVDEIWGAYIDYDPYTKLEIYLPYCGTHPLRVDDFMSGIISLKYKIDLLSGACVALIKATKPNTDTDDLDSIVYQFMGNCATQIPVTASQFADAIRSTMSLAASIGTMVATGVGGTAAAASKAGLSAVGKANLVSGLIGEGAAAAENVMGIKPAIERSGALGGAAGLLAVQTPYLIITRPRQAHPEKQSTYTGYPSFMTKTLEDVTGWTIVKAIHLDNIPCTVDEMAEIDRLLQEGVIF